MPGIEKKSKRAIVLPEQEVAPTSLAAQEKSKIDSPALVIRSGAQLSAAKKATPQSWLSSEFDAWVSELDTALAEEAGKSKSKAGTHDNLLYTLNSSTDGRLVVYFNHAKKLGTDTWGKLTNLDVGRILSGNVQYVTDVDLEIAKLFLSDSRYGSRSSSQFFPEPPELCQILIERLLSTGRCYWADTLRRPLGLGKPMKGSLKWVEQQDGKQSLKLESEGNIATFAGKVWYINQKSRLLGPLELPVSARILKLILNAPPLDPSDAFAAAKALGKLGKVIPQPKADFATEVVTVTPVARLVLTMDTSSSGSYTARSFFYNNTKVQAMVFFDYAPVKFGRDEYETRVIDGKKIRIHMKDSKAEAQRLDQLEMYDLERLKINVFNRCDGIYGFPVGNDIDWIKFTVGALPELQKLGWQVEFDKSFKLDVLVPEEIWQVDATESGDFWFSLDLGINVDGKKLPLLPIISEAVRRIPGVDPLFELEKLNHDGTFYAPLPGGNYVALPFDRVRAIITALVELFDKQKYWGSELPKISMPQMIELARAIDSHGGDSAWLVDSKLQQLIGKIKNFNGMTTVAPPKSFRAELRQYQLEGLSWLNFVREFELGGILADDMGLGKTVQTLAHIAVEKSAKRLDKPVLVVCPTSVLPNWMSEIEKFTPTLKATALWGKERADNYSLIAKSDIVVTTYPLVARDVETLLEQKWKAVVLDEAQVVKNPSTQIAQAVGKLRCDYRLCLTGTPIENHLGELWSQFNFLMPGFLSDLPTFTRTFRTPIEKQKDTHIQKQLAAMVRPFLLRRTKELVAKDLPDKTIMIKRVELEGPQRDLYETVRLAMYEKVKDALASKGLAKSQIVILDAILKLRQVCCDPRLVSIPSAKKVQSSAKLDLLLGMLEELLDEGKKVLLFSQFTSMLDLIIPELKKRQIDFVEIRGDTTDRATPVERFQNHEVPLFLLSLKAGGTGLNLTAADTVIHYDPWWNPAVENQATDRAHRIGQKQAVFVFKLIATGTIEERLLELQDRKKAIADGIYGSENALPSKLTAEDLESLFGPG
ncbi:MAG: helicase [Cyanobacteria bacterium DS3.002]|nr:helicase [Cyanobacteria bacterium DS3.002]